MGRDYTEFNILPKIKSKGISFWANIDSSKLKHQLLETIERYRDYPDFTYLYESVYMHDNHLRYPSSVVRFKGRRPFVLPFGRSAFLTTPTSGVFYMLVSTLVCVIVLIVSLVALSKIYDKFNVGRKLFTWKYVRGGYEWKSYPLPSFLAVLFLLFVFIFGLDFLSPILRYVIVIIDVYQNPVLVTATLVVVAFGLMLSVWGITDTETSVWAPNSLLATISWFFSVFFWYLLIMQYVSFIVYILCHGLFLFLMRLTAIRLFGLTDVNVNLLVLITLYTPCNLSLSFIVGYFSTYALLLLISLNMWSIAVLTIWLTRDL